MIISSKTLNYLDQHLTDKHKSFQAYKCTILLTFVGIDYPLNYIGLKLLQQFEDLVPNFFVIPNNFIVTGVCKSILYLFFILKTNLLLILFM